MSYAKSSKLPRMFQWDAVDTSPDLGGVKLAIRFNEQTERTELDRVFCRWIYFHLRSKIFFWPSYAGGRSPPSPPYVSTTASGNLYDWRTVEVWNYWVVNVMSWVECTTLWLLQACARVTVCQARASRRRTCSARCLAACRCSAPRPSTRWRSPRSSAVCRRPSVSTLRCSVEFSVGQYTAIVQLWTAEFYFGSAH